MLVFTLLSFHDTATTEIYTLSLHDALPIYQHGYAPNLPKRAMAGYYLGNSGELPITGASGFRLVDAVSGAQVHTDRKSTRLNSSLGYISYAVFCLKKKKEGNATRRHRVRME